MADSDHSCTAFCFFTLFEKQYFSDVLCVFIAVLAIMLFNKQKQSEIILISSRNNIMWIPKMNVSLITCDMGRFQTKIQRMLLDSSG